MTGVAAETRERWAASLAAIGAFLSEAGIEPTPRHYDAAWRYLGGDDPEFRFALDQAVRQQGALTPMAVAAAFEAEGVLDSAALIKLGEEARAFILRASGLVDRSGADARAYGTALEQEARGLDAGGPPEQVIAGLVGLTRKMIERSRDVEDQLRRTSIEIDGLKRNLEEARESANSDPLTGLANRRALETRLAAATATARKDRTPLTVSIVDIDHFKAINDSFGHGVGDEVIKLVARALAGKQDRLFVSRYGGEEFVVVFEGLAPPAAAAEIERIRDEITRRDIKVASDGRRLGKLDFSAGVAGYKPRREISDMLKRADQALYKAKSTGRGRVCQAAE